MDYAIAIDRLRPGAKWLRSDDYATLVKTWQDETPIPSDIELIAAYAAWEVEQTTATDLRAAIKAVIQTAVGKSWDELTNIELRALLAVTIYNQGGLDSSGIVQPLNQWLDRD